MVIALDCSGDKITENKMGGACSTPRGNNKYIQNYGRKASRERYHMGEDNIKSVLEK